MRVPTALTCFLLTGALLLAGGCASSPSASRGPNGGAGGAAPSAGGQATTAGSSGAQTATGAASSAPDPASAAGAGTTAAGAGSAAAGGGPAQTSDERRAALDKRLNDSLGSFDAELRSEQQRVAQEHDTHQAAAAGSATTEGQGAGKAADGAGTAATEAPASESRGSASGKHGGTSRPRDRSGDLKSERASKKPDDNAGNGATAREIPDGSDDDVVARRLRQAAEQETDPELKDKLWKEYIDYKKNAQGK